MKRATECCGTGKRGAERASLLVTSCFGGDQAHETSLGPYFLDGRKRPLILEVVTFAIVDVRCKARRSERRRGNEAAADGGI